MKVRIRSARLVGGAILWLRRTGGSASLRRPQLFGEIQNSVLYVYPVGGSNARLAKRRAGGDEEKREWGGLEIFCTQPETGVRFFIWIPRDPLKSPDSDE